MPCPPPVLAGFCHVVCSKPMSGYQLTLAAAVERCSRRRVLKAEQGLPCSMCQLHGDDYDHLVAWGPVCAPGGVSSHGFVLDLLP